MRRYADPVEVRQGPLEDDAQEAGAGAAEGPQQFLWRGRLWKVRAVLAHWVETGPWWQSTGVRAVLGSEEEPDGADGDDGAPAGDGAVAAADRGPVPLGDLLTERELWRVEAGAGRVAREEEDGGGVFDLSFDWSDGRWTLVGCTD